MSIPKPIKGALHALATEIVRIDKYSHRYSITRAYGWDILRDMAKQELEAALSAAPAPGTEYLIFVPGLFRCTECGFVLSKATINAQTMEVGLSDANLVTETCPNDQTMMVKMTWKEHAIGLAERLEREFASRAAKEQADGQG